MKVLFPLIGMILTADIKLKFIDINNQRPKDLANDYRGIMNTSRGSDFERLIHIHDVYSFNKSSNDQRF